MAYETTRLAKLKLTPSGLFDRLQLTIYLVESRGRFQLRALERHLVDNRQKRWRVNVAADIAEQQLAALRTATIPALPVSPVVCDGEFIELTVYGQQSTLTLGWWTISPDGAETLGAFADWMHRLAVPEINHDALSFAIHDGES